MHAFLEKLDQFIEWGGIKKQIVFLILSGVFLVLDIAKVPMPFPPAWVAILLCGVPIVLEAFIGLVTSFDIRAGVLVSMALIAAICIGEDFAAGEVAFIMQLGELLEALTVRRARRGIEKLVHLSPLTARIICCGEARTVPCEAVSVGDTLRVLPGEKIPVDGIVLSGETTVNEAVMTGESLPVDKREGDLVYSGTENQFGAFDMQAQKVSEDSAMQRLIRLVKSADAGKAKIVGICDRWATYIVAAALSLAILTLLFTGEIIRAVTILVVFCPCALVLATPTAIMAAIGNAAKHGFLIREGDALERLSKVSKITFDKTGTLTYGVPKVKEVVSVSAYSLEEIYAFAAGAEQFSEHPIGKAIVRSYKKETGQSILSAENFHMMPGMGVSATIGGKEIRAGKETWIGEAVPCIENEAEVGNTVIYVSVEGAPAGYIVLADKERKESREMLRAICAIGLSPVLLTGDRESTTKNIAAKLGIESVHAECLPEEKLSVIDAYQKDGAVVCMVGDGINDAPALKKADVSIAMGGVGSDIAAEAADIVLIDDEVKELPHLFALSKRMMRTIRWNVIFSMGLNFAAILFAMTGKLGPVMGALLHNAGSVAVIINSALLLRWKK